MKLPRVRFTIRRMIIVVALVGIAFASVQRLIVGDVSFAVEIQNSTTKPMRDIRLECNGQTLVRETLAPGGLLRGDFLEGRSRPVGGTQIANIQMCYVIDDKTSLWKLHPRFDRNGHEPQVRYIIREMDGVLTLNVDGTSPRVSETKRRLRMWWFWLFPPNL